MLENTLWDTRGCEETSSDCGKKQGYCFPSTRNPLQFFMSATNTDERPPCCKSSSSGSTLSFTFYDSPEEQSSALTFKCYYQRDGAWQNRQLRASLAYWLEKTRCLVNKYHSEVHLWLWEHTLLLSLSWEYTSIYIDATQSFCCSLWNRKVQTTCDYWRAPTLFMRLLILIP